MISMFEVRFTDSNGLLRIYDCGRDRERAFSLMNDLKKRKDALSIFIIERMSKTTIYEWHKPEKKKVRKSGK